MHKETTDTSKGIVNWPMDLLEKEVPSVLISLKTEAFENYWDKDRPDGRKIKGLYFPIFIISG